jgi:predicted amidohydrolase YtcJ
VLAAAVVGSLATAMTSTSGGSSSQNAPIHADTILKNAHIRTADEKQPEADVVAIRSEQIIYVGTGDDSIWRQHVGPATKVIDVEGRTVIPGIIDSHTHPGSVALSSWRLALPITHDLEAILKYAQEYAEAHPPSEVPFIHAEYYPSDLDWGPEGPTAAVIDAYVSDRPVVLEDISGHASIVNTKMLELMGVDANTPLQIDPDDPAPRFVRGADGVTPTGWVHEKAWGHFDEKVWKAIGWSPPSQMTPDLLYTFTRFLTSMGITALFDAASGEQNLAAASALDEQGKLNLFYHAALVFVTVDELPKTIATIRDLQDRYGGKHLRINAVKLFLDGTNEHMTSAVLEPFLVGKNDHGSLRMSEDDLVTSMLRLNAENIDLHIHVGGDRAFHTILNAVERAYAKLRSDWRIQVTAAHSELIDPPDMSRAANLGIIVNWTPHWTGGEFGDAAAKTLGFDRFNRMWQFNPFIDAGGIITFSSDVVSAFELNRADPFLGMQVAHTRTDPVYPMPPGPGTVPGTTIRKPLDARLSLANLLEGYTVNGAKQLRLPNQGSIKPGNLANMSILNANFFNVPNDEVQDVQPVAVLFEGEVVSGAIPGRLQTTTADSASRVE